MSLQTRLTALVQAIGADIKTLNTKVQATSRAGRWTLGSSGTLIPGNGALTIAVGAADANNTPGFVFDATGVTIPETGWWQIGVFGQVNNGTSAGGGFLSPTYNGSTTGEQQGGAWVVNGVYRIQQTQTVYLNAGAKVAASIFSYVAGATWLGGSLAINKVGGPKGDKGDTGGNATVVIDPWHVVGTTGEPAFNTAQAWQNLDAAGASQRALRFTKDPLGRVMLTGVVKGNSNTVIFTLPAGYRPVRLNEIFNANASGGTAQVVVSANGDINATNLSGNVALYVSLDGIIFDTETVTQMPTGPQGPKGDPGGVNVVTTLDWNTALTPNFYRSVPPNPTDPFQKTANGPGDPLNPPPQAGIVSAHEDGSLTQRVWDLSMKVAYTRYRSSGGAWTAWVADLVKPPLQTGLTVSGTTPQEGDERYFQNAAMKALGILWRFRYDATAPAGKPKWVFAGGSSWLALAETGVGAVAGASVTMGDIAITLPLGGDYMAEHGGRSYNSAAPGYGNASQVVRQMRGATLIQEASIIDFWTALAPSLGSATSITPHQSRASRWDGMAESDQLLPVFKTAGTDGLCDHRWLKVTPIRVNM